MANLNLKKKWNKIICSRIIVNSRCIEHSTQCFKWRCPKTLGYVYFNEPKREEERVILDNRGYKDNGQSCRAFSHDVTAAILVFQTNRTAAMLVYQDNPVGVELFCYVKTSFCSNKLA